MRILIIQQDCRQYREKLFDELAKAVNGLDLLHFGKKRFPKGHVVRECEAPKKKFFSINWITGLYGYVKNYDAVIVVFDAHWLNAFFLSLWHKDKIIYWGHGLGRSWFVNQLRKVVSKRARSIITYDDKGKEGIISLGVDPRKVFVANNTQYVPNSGDLSSEPKNSFLFVGRIQVRKQVEDLIEAFAMIKDKLQSTTKVVIVGDGEHQKELRKKAENLKVEDFVDFIQGTTDEETLKEHFSRAYAYVSPGHVGLGVLHSFAYGVPVITYRGDHHAPEYSNIVDGVNGFIVEPGLTNLAATLLVAVEERNYKQMGENAYKHYKENRQISSMVESFQNAITLSPDKKKHSLVSN